MNRAVGLGSHAYPIFPAFLISCNGLCGRKAQRKNEDRPRRRVSVCVPLVINACECLLPVIIIIILLVLLLLNPFGSLAMI